MSELNGEEIEHQIFLMQVAAYVPRHKLSQVSEICSRMLAGLALEGLRAEMTTQPLQEVDAEEFLTALGDEEDREEDGK